MTVLEPSQRLSKLWQDEGHALPTFDARENKPLKTRGCSDQRPATIADCDRDETATARAGAGRLVRHNYGMGSENLIALAYTQTIEGRTHPY